MDNLEHPLIRRPRPLLSGRSMLEHHVGNYDFHTRMNRLVRQEEELGQEDNIGRLKDDFRKILAQQRVGKAESYSEGDWEGDRKRVRIKKAVGKWHLYGYLEEGTHFLDGYEALHLMEMNRLIVHWDTVVVSLEQAYSLFLGYPESLTLEEYQVFSTLMRGGFYVMKCDSKRKYKPEKASGKQLSDEEKCVWHNLFRLLRQPNPLMDAEKIDANTELYSKVRVSMADFGSKIKLQESQNTETEDVPNSNSEKRKHDAVDSDAENNPKRFKTGEENSNEAVQSTKIDRFIDLFDSFDVVKSTLGAPSADLEQTYGKLLFDVFPSDGSVFRKSEPVIPEYRIVVRMSAEPLLSAADVAALYHQQPKPEVPVLLMQVSDTLSIHCFLYSFYELPRNLITAAPPERSKSTIAEEDYSSERSDELEEDEDDDDDDDER